MLNGIMKQLGQINFFLVIGVYFIFLAGILYGSLFAAIGAAVDNETDTEFMFDAILHPDYLS
jgi:hypothetical protein